jgi:hypothetical protein
MSATIVAVQFFAAKLSTNPRCATLHDRDGEREGPPLTTPALSGLGHDARTNFRRELCKLSDQMLEVANIMSHTRKLAGVDPCRNALFASGAAMRVAKNR